MNSEANNSSHKDTQALEPVITANQNKPQPEFFKTTTYRDLHKKNDNKSYLSHLKHCC